MNDTISNLPTYWSQPHQHATTFVTTPTITTSITSITKVNTSLTYNNNNNNNNNNIIPSANNSMVNEPQIHQYRLDVLSKPIKKRSRSYRRAPTTLLNTSTTDFRSLVQQFTGCHNMKRSFSKGPVNLSFGTSTTSKSHNNIIGLATNSRVAPFGFGYYTNQQAKNPGQVQHQQLQEVLRRTKQYEGMKTSTLDDFVIDDILSTNEFVDEFSINRSMQDGFYF